MLKMVLPSRICYLRCITNSQKRISLPHDKPVIIGRNEETGITDIHVSRNHLEFTANCDEKSVKVRTLGKCYSGCNGYALIQNETYHFKHGDRVEVRLGFHKYDIIFEEDAEPQNKKTKFDIFNMTQKASSQNSDLEFNTSGKWEDVDGKELLIYTHDQCTPQNIIAAFDLDGTLIKTKSGARFPKDPNDWVLNINTIPQKLQKLHQENNKIVIFSNQSGLGNDSSKVREFKLKIEKILNAVKVPAQVFIATGKSIYRKPAPGMWNFLQDHKNSNISIDINKSFFVGDAAGREKNWAPKKNKDHSIADRLFALNLGIQFYTPEEYFLKASSVSHIMPEFDPRNIPNADCPNPKFDKQEVVVMVGSQGSGKSFYCKTHLLPKGFIHISRDKLGSWQKCVKQLEECLQKKQSVVIDNTNPDKESRRRYIEIANKYGVSCRCFLMTTSHKHAKHNNKFRQLTDKSHIEVGDMLLNSYKKNFQEPELTEGFQEIVKIPFIPKFEKDDHETLYRTFLLDT